MGIRFKCRLEFSRSGKGPGCCISNKLLVMPMLLNQKPHSEDQEAKLTCAKVSGVWHQGHSIKGNSDDLITGVGKGTLLITSVSVHPPGPRAPFQRHFSEALICHLLPVT